MNSWRKYHLPSRTSGTSACHKKGLPPALVTEDGKVALRNIRRDVMHDLKELRDAGEAGADDEHRAEEALQKLTDDKVKELDALLKGKEAEILEV